MSLFEDEHFKLLDQSDQEEKNESLFPSAKVDGNQLKIGDQVFDVDKEKIVATEVFCRDEKTDLTVQKDDDQLSQTSHQNPKIPERLIDVKVISVGGGGGNALDYMIKNQIDSVEYICANTDQQDLNRSLAENKVQLGVNLTQGLGAGSKPEVGYAAAMESTEEIKKAITGARLLFITAGMGGGTGTCASAVIAQVAKDLGILTVAVVTKPFEFEGQKRMEVAHDAIETLKEAVDSLIVVPNERLLSYLPENISLPDAFKESNQVLYNAVSSIVNLLIHPGFINVDYADIETVMSQKGLAIMGSGEASGEERILKATQVAIENPLVEEFDFSSAKALLVNVSASSDLGIREFHQVGEQVKKIMSPDANLITGVSYDDALGEKVRVTIIATGYDVEQDSNRPLGDQSEVENIENKPFAIHVDVVGTQTVERKKRVNERHEDVFLNSSEKDQDIPAFLRKQAD